MKCGSFDTYGLLKIWSYEIWSFEIWSFEMGLVLYNRTLKFHVTSEKNLGRICCEPPCCIALIFFISVFNDDLSKKHGECPKVRSYTTMTA